MGSVPYSQMPQVLLAVPSRLGRAQGPGGERRRDALCPMKVQSVFTWNELVLDASTAMGRIALSIQPFLTVSSQARRKLEPDQKRKALRYVQSLHITIMYIAIAGDQKEGRLKTFFFPEHHMAVTHPFPFLQSRTTKRHCTIVHTEAQISRCNVSVSRPVPTFPDIECAGSLEKASALIWPKCSPMALMLRQASGALWDLAAEPTRFLVH